MLRSILVWVALACSASFAAAQSALWKELDEKPMLARAAQTGSVAARRNIVPQVYRAMELNRGALEALLANAPSEFSEATAELELPLPDGGFARFALQESSVMEPELAARFPEIKTYVGQGIDDPSAVVRMDLTPQGLHAMVLSPRGSVFVDPYWRDRDSEYVVYNKRDFAADEPFTCAVDESRDRKGETRIGSGTSRPTGAALRKYRLAVACTGEYATFVSAPDAPNISRTLAAMVTSVNRVSAIYEREFAIRFSLIGNTDKLIYLDPDTDPYTNSSGSTMLSENQSNIDSVIGSANYDFGHVFSTGGGGIAQVGVICVAGSKARGVTGNPRPTGDPFDVDYVAHEMGHQFGASHTFNSVISQCQNNRASWAAYEPGSGTTVMAYAGICGDTNLAPNSDDYFHSASYTEIDDFTNGFGGSCAVNVSTGNSPPVISAPGAFTIPANTPFALTGNATDANGDTLTYDWEEFDLGSAQSTTNPISSSSNPLFRSYPPKLSPTRYFPALTYVLNNSNTPPPTYAIGNVNYATGEVLPSNARTMNFRLTVRDNHAGAGGSNWASTSITTVNTGAAFAVTWPNASATLAGGSQQSVTWNVAGSDANGINCASVKISLSTDGGNTFPTVLASSVPNNGSALVTLPQVATTQGRIKVEAVGNIFFDISDANLTITSTNSPPVVNVTNTITVARGTPAATNAIVASATDADGDALSATVVDAPYGATITPGISGNNVSLSAVVDCALVTTRQTRTYPFTLIVTDVKGASTSVGVNLVVTPNPSPTLGTYPNMTVARTATANATPSAPAADANGNLSAAPYSVTPTTLPGGGSISINQANGVVTLAPNANSTLGSTTVRVTVLDGCGAAAISSFTVNVVPAYPIITSAPPPSPVIVGSAYSHTFTATGAPAPTFSLTSGTLPPGLGLSPSGVLSGTPTSAGNGNFPNITVTASNGNPPDAQQTFSLSAVTRAANYLASFGLNGGNAGLLVDYDGDGLPNLLEYALDLNPTSAGLNGLPLVVLKDYGGTKYLSLTFTRSSVATDLTYVVQGTSDLVNWSDLATSSGGGAIFGPGVVSETGSAPLFTDEVRDTVPFSPSGPRRFLRLKVSTP